MHPVRLTDVDNHARLEQARALYHALNTCVDQHLRLMGILRSVEERAELDRLRTGRDTRKAEIWTLKERLYLAKLDMTALSGKLNEMCADLSRRTGETESHIRGLIAQKH
jgi:hypothetical protein